jgi:hypothetical protein
MKISFLVLLIFNICIAVSPDSTVLPVSQDTMKNMIKTAEGNLITKNPVTSAVLSLFPGGGQIYTGNYIKSGLFVSLETIIGIVAFSRFSLNKNLSDNSKMMYDSMMLFKDSITVSQKTIRNKSNTVDSSFEDTTFYSWQYQMNYDYNHFLEKDNHCFIYQSLAWMGGIYYWNILDALKNTKYFMNENPKQPSTAGWLAAVPALGLGQLYNGELSKAGMVFTIQMNMAYMIYNYNSLMRMCENVLDSKRFLISVQNQDPTAVRLKGSWEAKRNDAFRNRNMWAWYSIAFYFYSIFDAIVDAHLHDASKKMRLEPDLLPGKGVGLHYTLTF